MKTIHDLTDAELVNELWLATGTANPQRLKALFREYDNRRPGRLAQVHKPDVSFLDEALNSGDGSYKP